MAKLETEKTEIKIHKEDSSSLKGTLYAVFGLGAFLIISWLCVYFLFIGRM